jgi:biopolymer transport protein ExbD
MKLERAVRLNPYLLFIVPLVEIVCLLLLLFVVSSTFLVHPGISVNLPFSKFTLGTVGNSAIVTVTAGPFPRIYYRDQAVTLDQLKTAFEKDPVTDKSIIIRADRDAPQGSVVQVMNLCLDRGYSVILATSPKSP